MYLVEFQPLILIMTFNQSNGYRLNAHVSSKFIDWNLTPSMMVFGGEGFGRWSGLKDGALKNGISVLIK